MDPFKKVRMLPGFLGAYCRGMWLKTMSSNWILALLMAVSVLSVDSVHAQYSSPGADEQFDTFTEWPCKDSIGLPGERLSVVLSAVNYIVPNGEPNYEVEEHVVTFIICNQYLPGFVDEQRSASTKYSRAMDIAITKRAKCMKFATELYASCAGGGGVLRLLRILTAKGFIVTQTTCISAYIILVRSCEADYNIAKHYASRTFREELDAAVLKYGIPMDTWWRMYWWQTHI